jgi:hypothetical protein
MKTDFREYTLREFGKSATAIEIHLKQAAQDSEFCNDCIQKHFLEIEKFAEEGAGFFPENKDWWENVETEARNEARKLTLVRKDQGRFNEQAKLTAPWLRKRRKEAVAMLEDEIDRQDAMADEPMAKLAGEKAYLVGHAGRRADLGAMDPDDMTEEQAHAFLMNLAGLDETNLEGAKAYLIGHAGRRADLGCLLGGCGESHLGAHFPDEASKKKAKKEGCTCLLLPGGGRNCFAKGGIGALNEEQRNEYCTPENTVVKKIKNTSPLAKSLDRFRKGHQRCRANAAASVRPAEPDRAVKVFAHYTGCMSGAIKKGATLPKKIKPVEELPPSKTPKVAPSESRRAGHQVSVDI